MTTTIDDRSYALRLATKVLKDLELAPADLDKKELKDLVQILARAVVQNSEQLFMLAQKK